LAHLFGKKTIMNYVRDDDGETMFDGEHAVEDYSRGVKSKPRCNRRKSTAPPTAFTGILTTFRAKAALDVWQLPAGNTWVLPSSGRRYRTREAANDRSSASRTVAADAQNYYGPFLPADVPSSYSPSSCRKVLNAWRRNNPEEKHPDYRADGSGIIPSEWTPPRNNSSKHSAIADHLEIVLAYHRALRDSNEPMQTNFFVGDNDNATKYDDSGEPMPPLNAAGE
jgi:hypothetical protein